MKKIFALLLAMTMVFALAACGDGNDTPAPSGSGTGGTSQQEQPSSTPANDEWPDNEWTKLICKPTTGKISSHKYSESSELYTIFLNDWSLEDAEAYMNELAAMGFVDLFTDGEPEMEDKMSFRKCHESMMKNNNGYEVSVAFYPENNRGVITISGGTTGQTNGGAQNAGWPTEGYGALIPEPEWEYEIVQDDEYRFIVTFEDVSLEDRQAYTQKLIEAGFDHNPWESGEGTSWAWISEDYDKEMTASVEDNRILVEPS